MLPTQNEVTQHIEALLVQLKAYSIDAYGLPLNDLKPIITFKETRMYGQGGSEGLRPFMKLNLGPVIKYPVRAYTEYRSLNERNGINGFETTDWKLWIDALVIHEFAHVVQHMLTKRPNRLATDTFGKFERFGYAENGHGQFFMRIYKDLRVKFLNDRIGKYSPVTPNFVKTEEQRDAKLQLCLYNGVQVIYGGRVYTVKGRDTKKRKLDIVGYSSCGMRLNMDREYVSTHRIN